jgi:hypothetical protein
VSQGVEKPFSQACENNKGPILAVLKEVFQHSNAVLEIGSGTGQHAVYFAPGLPHLRWYCSDVEANHAGINAWLTEFPAANLVPPCRLMLGRDPWPPIAVDAIYTANTTHIMQRHEAKLMLQLVQQHLPIGGVFCQYGPFSQGGEFSSQSNRDFDQSLRERGYGGVQDVDTLERWAQGLALQAKIAMPANNLCLIWRKI